MVLQIVKIFFGMWALRTNLATSEGEGPGRRERSPVPSRLAVAAMRSKGADYSVLTPMCHPVWPRRAILLYFRDV